MKSVFASILICAALATSAGAQTRYYYPPPATNRLDRKVDGHTQYNIGRAAEPPSSEAEKLFMTLITSDSWQNNERERQLVSWLNNDQRLAKLRNGTRFNWYSASNPHYRDRLRYKFGEALPILAIQRPDGEAVLNVTAISMPRTSGELADMADDAINARYAPPSSFSNGPARTQIVEDCPNCPDDSPAPPNDDSSQVQPIPEVIPTRPHYWMYVLAGIGGLAFAGFVLLVAAVLLWPRAQTDEVFTA